MLDSYFRWWIKHPFMEPFQAEINVGSRQKSQHVAVLYFQAIINCSPMKDFDSEYGETVNLFWTAGLDSTFRLLELLLMRKSVVQPIYIIDFHRCSLSMELQRMADLRRLIIKRCEEPGKFRPTRMYFRSDFPVSDEVYESFRELRSRLHIGTQYMWLAQFCRDAGFGDSTIEMCMPKHEPPSDLQWAIFDDPQDPEPKLKNGNGKMLFRYYSFPTLHRTKHQMEEYGKDNGFSDILEQSWFCYSPIRGLPCGVCNPCQIARVDRPNVKFSRLGKPRRMAGDFLRFITRSPRRTEWHR